KHAYCLKTQPATGETYPKSDLFNKATHLVKPWVGGFTPDKLGYYYTKDMYIKKHPSASGDGR
ncbi:hypothetical protein, partial [Klebsiella quasipneumoniae]